MDNFYDAMEIIVGLLFLVAAGWILGIAGFVQARQALRETRTLREALAAQTILGDPAGAAPVVQPQPVRTVPEPAAPIPSVEPTVPIPAQPAPVRPARARIDIEQLLTQRWGVWLGAAALLLAAVFLVRTAAEQGWLGPAPRCALAFALGAALILAAEWLQRRPAPGGMVDYAPSALAAGGVAAWLAGAYAAGPMYELVTPIAAFVLVAAAGLAGLALSLRFGPLVALVGLAGAFATPLLVDTGSTSAAGLFGYLLLVSAAAWAVVRYTAWAWLGWTASGAGALWIVVYSIGSGAEVAAPGLFMPAAVALSLALMPSVALDTAVGRRLSWIPALLLGLAGLGLAAITGEPAARLGVLLLAPLTVTKAWTEPRLARLPYLAALLTVGVLLSWSLPQVQATGEAISIEGAIQAVLPGPWASDAILPFLETAGAMALWFAVAGAFLERRSPRPELGALPGATLLAAVPLLVLIAAYLQVGRFQPDAAWAAAAAVLAAALVGIAAASRTGTAGVQRAGVHATGAVGALALGCAILLTAQWLTVAVALFLPALAWIEHRAGLPPLRRVALIVAGVVLVRLVLNPFVLAYDVGSWPILNGLLLAYGVPAVCFALTARMLRRGADDLVVAVLEAGACAFAALGVALEVHHAVDPGRMAAFDSGFVEAAVQVSAAGAVAVVLQRVHSRSGRVVLGAAWRLLGGLALAGGAALLVFNPGITGDIVGRSLLGNALLPAYAVPAALALVALQGGATPRRLLAGYALLAAFAWVTLEVRQVFHPGALDFDGEPFDDFEVWAYSGAWLLLGAALMAAGLRIGQRGLRLAALALVALVAAKVFLLDMAGLGGLWRVLSFLGLGLSLIGLGAFYRRYVVPPAVTSEPSVAAE